MVTFAALPTLFIDREDVCFLEMQGAFLNDGDQAAIVTVVAGRA